MYLLVAVLCVSGGYVSAQAPAFCKNAECPQFNTISSNQNYAIRQYGPLTWATTSFVGQWKSNILGQLFGRLFNYIQGNNTLGQVMPMTVPVLTRIESAGQAGTKYTMHFMIPASNSRNIPGPVDPNVSLMTTPPATYYIRSFGGYANGQKSMSELQTLVNSINNPQTYDDNFFMTATYDSPSVKTNRHNEVWLQKIA
ncbi:hypothetical protein SNE40_011455 [Patella caerulea]